MEFSVAYDYSPRRSIPLDPQSLPPLSQKPATPHLQSPTRASLPVRTILSLPESNGPQVAKLSGGRAAYQAAISQAQKELESLQLPKQEGLDEIFSRLLPWQKTVVRPLQPARKLETTVYQKPVPTQPAMNLLPTQTTINPKVEEPARIAKIDSSFLRGLWLMLTPKPKSTTAIRPQPQPASVPTPSPPPAPKAAQPYAPWFELPSQETISSLAKPVPATSAQTPRLTRNPQPRPKPAPVPVFATSQEEGGLLRYLLLSSNRYNNPYGQKERTYAILFLKLAGLLSAAVASYNLWKSLGQASDANGLLAISSVYILSGIFLYFGENLNILIAPANPYQIREVR